MATSSCPPLVAYTLAEQRAAADAMLDATPILKRMVEDYGELRARVRGACGG